MLNKEMTRKQFLGVVGACFGLLILRRLQIGGDPKPLALQHDDSYGNGSYGGQKKK
jgi:hypothetical protein